MLKHKPLPHLNGYMHDPDGIIDNCLAYFFAGDETQSYLSMGSLETIHSIIKRNGNNIPGVADETQTYLNEYLRRYFGELISVITSYTEMDERPYFYTITIDITLTDQRLNKRNFKRAFQMDKGSLAKVASHINEGWLHDTTYYHGN